MKKLFLFTAAAVTIVAGWFFVNKFIFKSRASEEILQIYPEKQELSAVVGEPFTTKVMLQGPAGKKVSAAKIEMYYDKTKLVFIGTDETDTSCTTLEHQIQITDDTASSKVVWSKVSFKKKDDLPQGLICFGILRFKPIAAGAVVISPVISTTIEAVGPNDTFAIRTNEKSNLAVTISAGPFALTQEPGFIETFSGNAYSSIFTKGGSLASSATAATVVNNALLLKAGSAAATESASLVTKKLYSPNFVARMEFDSFRKTGTPSYAVVLGNWTWNSATDYAGIQFQISQEADNKYYSSLHVYKSGATDIWKTVNLPDTITKGTLILTREGATVKAVVEYDGGTKTLDTVTAYTTAPGVIEASLWANQNSLAEVKVKKIQLTPTVRTCTTATSCTYTASESPAALYKFNEGTGTVVSNSIDNMYSGTFSGTGVHWISGKNGMAGNFEGDDDFVVVPDADLFSSPQFTVSGWYKWDGKRYATSTNKNWAVLFSKGIYGAATDEYALYLQRLDTSVDTNMSFYMNGAKIIDYPNSTLDTAWHYISVSYDGTTAKLFIDAHKVAEKTASVLLRNSTSPFALGAQSDGVWPYGGVIDNVSYFPAARTEAQLADDMKVENEYVIPTPAPTVSLTGVAGSQLDLKLHFMGVPDKPTKNQTTVTVTLTKKDGTEPKKFENILLTAASSNDWTGFVTLKDVAPGEYYILIKGPKHLQRKFCHLVPEPGTTGGDTCPAGTAGIVLGSGTVLLDAAKVPLAPGDLAPQDATFNANDISKFQKHMFKNDSGALDLADVNYDGVVNGNDFAILLQSMAKNFTDEL